MTEETFKIIQLILTILAGFTIWFKDTIAIKFGLKKNKVQVEEMKLDNLKKNLDLYQEMVTDLSLKYKERIIDLEDTFNQTIDKLHKDLNELKDINKKLNDFIKKQNLIIEEQNKQLEKYNK